MNSRHDGRRKGEEEEVEVEESQRGAGRRQWGEIL